MAGIAAGQHAINRIQASTTTPGGACTHPTGWRWIGSKIKVGPAERDSANPVSRFVFPGCVGDAVGITAQKRTKSPPTKHFTCWTTSFPSARSQL